MANKTDTFNSDVPLIDRELFFGNPEISGGQISPDGKWISFMKEYKGIMNIWVKPLEAPFAQARPITENQRPLYGYYWTEDAKYIVYVKDNDGDENINAYAVNPHFLDDSNKIPHSTNLTPLKDVAVQIYAVSQIDPDLMMVGMNDRDKAWHDLYQLRISTGELKMVYTNKERITGYEFDWNDQLRVLYRTDIQGTTQFLYLNGEETTIIYETLVTEHAYICGWNENNSKCYLVSNKEKNDLSSLFLLNPETGDLELVESDPKNEVDFGSLRLDRNTRNIISTSYTKDRTTYYWKDEKWAQMYHQLENVFPKREISVISYTHDYNQFLISVGGDRYVSDVFLYDVASGQHTHQYTPRPGLKQVESFLAPMSPLSYPSSDGLPIPSYLTLPTATEGKKLPLVVLVHGGPKGPRDYWGFNNTVQFLANRGYAVLQPNFRASGGYGRKFLNAGDLQWGRLMQDDITWGVKYLIEKGIADEHRIAIMGGSYGGYATLAGLAFTPTLYACGVDIVGPANIFTLLESIPPYWESGRAFLFGMTGDPRTSDGQQLIQAASPLFSADKIEKPLLVIQGANDPRVKKAEAEQIVIALRDKGKHVGYLLADDEGHGFAKPVNSMAMYAEIERFLAGVLGTRFQVSMSKEVADRLEELKVDVQTVTLKPS